MLEKGQSIDAELAGAKPGVFLGEACAADYPPTGLSKNV